MATPRIAGDTSPKFQFWEQNWKPWQGGYTSNTWMGTDIGQISTLAQSYLDAGYAGSLKFEKNIATLVIRQTDLGGSAGSQFKAIVDKWEVAVDQEKPELFENSNFLSLFVSVNSTYGLRIDQQFAQIIKTNANASPANWSNFWDLMNSTNLATNDGSDYTDGSGNKVSLYHLFINNLDSIGGLSGQLALKAFAEDYFRGATNFVHGKYSLKHTTICPSNYSNTSSNVTEQNIERIYSIAALLTECQDSSLWILPLPAYLAYKILNYPVPSAMPPNFEFGGLKMRSGATVMARGRIEITQEYLIDAWPIHTYGQGPQ